MNRPARSLPAILLPLSLMVSSALLVGCGDERLSDDAYGFIDLAPWFYDGSTPSNPTNALPRTLAPHTGWINGIRAEYYDFGMVRTVVKRTATSIPDYATVHPMYFFFDAQRNPLFSKPIYEARTGLWHMRGGKRLLNPNPRKDADKTYVYSIRTRDALIDKARNTSDYQRPILDRLQSNSDYSGLWEIWEVTVPEGYEPDAIKSFETLNAAIETGEFKRRRTQRVINCPVIDDRTYVQPTATYYNIPRPRIELWYRTKQGSCFLANGWETLGNEAGELYKSARSNAAAADDARRLDTFDIIRFTIAEGVAARTTVLAPIGRFFQPRVRVVDQDPSRSNIDIRYVGDFLSEGGLPRATPADPPGYRPIKWAWDISVPQDPPFEPGTFKKIEIIDPAQIGARSSGPWTRNFPLIGAAIGCVNDNDCRGLYAAPGIELKCNKTPGGEQSFLANALNEAPPGKTVDQVIRNREGGPRCDVPGVRFGEFCSPGVARCALETNDKPSHIALDPMNQPLAPRALAFSATGLTAYPPTRTGTNVGASYVCHPLNTGYCYIRCDRDAVSSGAPASVNITIAYEAPQGTKACKTKGQCDPGLDCTFPDGRGAHIVLAVAPAGGECPMGRECACPDGQRCLCKKAETRPFPHDSRCGNLPGYHCKTNTFTPSPPSRAGVCLRSCSSTPPVPFQRQWCAHPVLAIVNDKVNPDGAERDISQGMSCRNTNLDGNQTTGGSACQWDPAYEPRDPKSSFAIAP